MSLLRHCQLLSGWTVVPILLTFCGSTPITADELSTASRQSADFFRRHCVDCHGPDTQEAGIRLDLLSPPDGSAVTTELWTRILSQIDAGDMPPASQPRPAQADMNRTADWIGAALAKTVPRTPSLRRMNRTEYQNTVHDLLGIDTELAEYLPEDTSVQGFDNVAGGLGISSILLERYLEAADVAFDGTIRRIEPLPPDTRRAVLMEQTENQKAVAGGNGGVIESSGAFVDFTPGWPPARIDPAHPIEDGIYRCRVAVWPHHPGEQRMLAVAVYVGPLFGDGTREFIGMFDVTGDADNPRIIEFTTRMREQHTMHILPWVFPEHVTWRDKEEQRPGVAIAWAETYGPLDQDFPSAATRQLFGSGDSIQMAVGDPIYMRYRKGVRLQYVNSSQPHIDAERIIRDLVPRAFRRPVDDVLTEQFVQLALSRLDGGSTFEQAVRAGVSAVLCSPHFLLINQEPAVDDYTIASRLSYFLWSSMPDAELMELAAAGRLSDRQVRHQQVERMLQDPRSQRFIDNFTGQWLDLRDIEFTTPDAKLYPEYDELLLRSMVAETKGFFRHLLDQNLSVLNFVDSDFAFLNQRLAMHYGISGIHGHEQFQLVDLPQDSIRGGVLTQASVMKVTANGTNTSPVLRGVWVLDNLLGQPAPPPPPGVPAVEPDIRGATTLREQLDRHRSNDSCNRCHARIDPPGFALEEFD
ncbi:MAG: DUF1592 domain-containing protein, partial [Planctomycetaceae bacterium]|nr:DUF1592 domain-containing protein [Planctomycetaceae bacterium]